MSLVLIEYLTRASYVMYDIPRLQINREIENKIKNHAPVMHFFSCYS